MTTEKNDREPLPWVTWVIIIGSLLSIIFLVGYFWAAADDEEPKVPEYTYVNPNAYYVDNSGETGPTGDAPDRPTLEEVNEALDEYEREYLEACYAAGDNLGSETWDAHVDSCLRGVGIY